MPWPSVSRTPARAGSCSARRGWVFEDARQPFGTLGRPGGPSRGDRASDGDQLALDRGAQAVEPSSDERVQPLDRPIQAPEGTGAARPGGAIFVQGDHVTHAATVPTGSDTERASPCSSTPRADDYDARTLVTGARRGATVVQVLPASALPNTSPLVAPNQRPSSEPSPSRPSAWRRTVSHASPPGRPLPRAVHEPPASRVSKTRTFPSGVTRSASAVRGITKALSGSAGSIVSGNPNPLGSPSAISFQEEPASSLR